jgi:hypothetical protein
VIKLIRSSNLFILETKMSVLSPLESITLSGEIWKPYPHHERYLVSNKGRVWSSYIMGVMSPDVSSGYLRVVVPNEKGVMRLVNVHELVVLVFVGPRPTGLVIDHIDRNKLNNRDGNLRYVTMSVNSLNCTMKEPTTIPVNQYDLEENYIATWKSCRDASEHLSIYFTSIQRACNGNLLTAGGYTWEYLIEDLDGEEWKESVVNGQTLYASNCGRIRRVNGRTTSGSQGSDGYYRIKINSKTFLIHRVIAEIYHGPSPSSSHISNHIDEDRANNYPKNLEWVTLKENTNHSMDKEVILVDKESKTLATFQNPGMAAEKYDIPVANIRACCSGAIKSASGKIFKYSGNGRGVNKKSKSSGKKVIQMDLQGNELAKFDSCADAARKTGLCTSNISSCCRGETDAAGGFKWRYPDGVLTTTRTAGAKAVNRHSKNDVFIDKYTSIAEAARSLNIPRGRIDRSLATPGKVSFDHIWRYT